MGTIRNEMTIVHHWKKDELEKLRDDAIKFFNEVANGFSDVVVSPIMTSCINSEYTFVINGECSKIGWETSKRFHEARMKWCENHKYDVENIIVINFGEGDEPCRIVFDNNAAREEAPATIPYLMHKEMDIPISECQKAYDVAHDLANNLGKYVNYRIEHWPGENIHRFIGEIKVVEVTC